MKSKVAISRTTTSPARAAAFDILLRVERDLSYASELLHSHSYNSLTQPDHALATELVMGVLRWQSLLDSEIAHHSSQPLAKLDLEVLIALRLAVYQLRQFDRVPARAAINDSVELVKRARKRSAASYVNAVLRKIGAQTMVSHAAGEFVIDGETVKDLAARSAHPEWLVERWAESWGIDVARRICQYDQSIPATAIRLRAPEAEERLEAERVQLAPGALVASARRVLAGDVTKTAAYRSGQCVIQDEGSQLVAALMGKGSRILDCCAAPGGKTLAIADCNPEANVTAIELHPHRARLLRRLLGARDEAGGASDSIHVVAADARAIPFTATFDCVLADVPCSGTGTLARNPEIKWRIMPADFGDLQVRQFGILRAAMDRVAVGGRLIYSTCSLEKEENEDVVEIALAETSMFRVVDCGGELEKMRQNGELVWENPSSLVSGPYLRTQPGVHPCDGFFAAIVEKSRHPRIASSNGLLSRG